MESVTSTGGATAPAPTTPATTAKRKADVAGTTAHVPAKTTFHDDLAKAKEKLQPVHGRAYSKVMDGEREGTYVNTSGNARDGQAFALEYHGGRRWHVYGTGEDRTVVAFPKPGAKAPAADATTTPGTATPAETTPVTTVELTPAGQIPAVGVGGMAPADEDETGAEASR